MGNLADEVAYQKTMAALLTLAAAASAAYMQPIVGARGAVSRASPVNMQMQKKVISFDQDGLFEGRELSIPKAPVRLLERLEELKLLTSLSEAGLLSSAEEAGVFSKLEAAGAFSKAEALLPLADDLKLLSTVESLLNVEAGYLFSAGAVLLLGEAALITVVPDDNVALVGLQAVTGLAAGAGAVMLFATSFLFSLLQGEN